MPITDSTADIADWDRNAERYASTTWTASDRVYAQLREILWESIGEISDKHVLDVGCGHGELAFALHDRGAHVLGIDGSSEFVGRAKARCPHGRFLCHDLATGLPRLNQTFDLVTATMVLMDIPDLEPLFRDLRSCSRQGTRMLVTLNHPCFFYSDLEQDPKDGSWFRKVKTYLRHEIWRIPSYGGHNHYHRPLTFYFELFRRSGFVVRRFFEPTPIPAPDAVAPDFRREVPVFLLIEAEYQGAA